MGHKPLQSHTDKVAAQYASLHSAAHPLFYMLAGNCAFQSARDTILAIFQDMGLIDDELALGGVVEEGSQERREDRVFKN